MNARNIVGFICALLLAGPGSAWAQAAEAVKATYHLSRNGIHIAVIEESFERKGATYRVVSESTPVGVAALFVRSRVKIESSGTVTPAGLRPQRFEYGRLDDARKNVSADFDWAAEQLRMAYDGRKETAPLPQGAQDRLSLLYQFMFLPLEKLKTVAFQMTNGKKIQLYKYQINGSQQLDTPLGRLDALHLVKQRDAGDNNQIEVWLARSRNFMPVKIIIVERDGTKFDQVITRLEIK